MKENDFKARAMASLECFREEFTTKQLALDLYEIYGLKKPVDSWIAHVGACFNPNKPEFFSWGDIVNLCRITGRWEPINFMCDELGLDRPKQIDHTAKIAQLRAQIKRLRAETDQCETELQALMTDQAGQLGARFLRKA
jgi:hypothetical protein